MSGEWGLTAASLRNMKRCCSMAGPKDVRNKWLEEFKETHCHTEFGKTLYRLLRGTSVSLDAKEDAELMQIKLKELETTHAEFFDSLEADPVEHYNEMIEKGARNPLLFKILANRLSTNAAELICNLMFKTPDLNMLYVPSFFRHFLPVYLKRPYTWFTLDILVKANQIFPAAFRSLLHTLLKDPDVVGTVITDFVATLDDAGKSDFLNQVMDLQLNHREFARNLPAIESAYDGAEKTERLQLYIYNSLSRYATFLAADWNYGRLLLAYIQALGNDVDIAGVERLIQTHRSPFKRTCVIALLEVAERLNAEQEPENPS